MAPSSQHFLSDSCQNTRNFLSTSYLADHFEYPMESPARLQ